MKYRPKAKGEIFEKKDELIEFLLESQCLKFDKSCSIITEHIGRVCHYLDLSRLFLSQDTKKVTKFYGTIGKDIADIFPNFDTLAGIPHIGALVAARISDNIDKRFLSLGSENFGKEDLIERINEVKNRNLDKVVLFDDVSASGRSLAEATLLLTKHQIQPLGAYSVYDKNLYSKEHLAIIGAELHSYFTFEDLVPVCLDMGKIDSETIDNMRTREAAVREELQQENWDSLVESITCKPISESEYSQRDHIPLEILEYYARGLLSKSDLSDLTNFEKHMTSCNLCSTNLEFYQKKAKSQNDL